MLFLIPIILFGLTAVGLIVLRLRGMRMAYIWLLPAFITLVCWILFLILTIPLTSSVIKIPWLYSLEESGSLVFSLDSHSWGFVFLLISLVPGYFFTLPIRLKQEKRTVLWIGWMLLSICAVLSFTAGNIVTLILAWTLFDLVDFTFSYFVLKTAAEEQSLADTFLPKILSISLLIIAIVFLGSGSNPLIQNSLQPIAYFLILFAALFRTGLLPFRIDKVAEDQSGASFEFLKKITLVLSGFSLLSHLPANFLNGISSSLLSFIFLSLSLLFAILTLAKHQRSIEVWLDALICLALISVFSGTPQFLLGWAGVVLVGAGIQQFYTMRSSKFNFFALLGVVAVSGLPFTIGMAALNGLSSKGFFLWEILCLPVFSLLILALIQKITSPQKDNPSVESWYLSLYLFGLFLLTLSPFALIVKNVITPANAFENWWMGVLVVIITLFAFLLTLRKNAFKTKLEEYSNKLAPVLEFLRFHWLKVVWKWLSLVITEVFSFITQLLEGEGGVIWAIVMLALLVSIIGAGRS
jgi:hypothetical protein